MGSGELSPGLGEGRIEGYRLLVIRHGPPQVKRISGAVLKHCLSAQERVVGGDVRRRPLGQPLLRGGAKRDVERLRHPARMSACTWKTFVSWASNDCCHFVVGAEPPRTCTSS